MLLSPREHHTSDNTTKNKPLSHEILGEWTTGQPRLKRRDLEAETWNEPPVADLTCVCLASPVRAHNSAHCI